MKKTVAVLGVMSLSACMGSGGGGVETARNDPIDPVVNTEMGSILNNTRTVSMLPGLEYNSIVGGVAQDHANDMFNRNYLSTFDQGTTGYAGLRGERDMGDDLNELNRRWDEIVQMVAQGEKASTQALFDELLARTAADGIEGDIGEKLQAALDTDVDFEFFGLGKAGSGSNQRWALIVVDPDNTWTERP